MQAKPVAKGSAAVGAVRASTSLKSVEFEVFGKVRRELPHFLFHLPYSYTIAELIDVNVELEAIILSAIHPPGNHTLYNIYLKPPFTCVL
jgi:hypothetical protein